MASVGIIILTQIVPLQNLDHGLRHLPNVQVKMTTARWKQGDMMKNYGGGMEGSCLSSSPDSALLPMLEKFPII